MKTLFNREGKLPMIALIAVGLVLVLGIGAVAVMKMGKGSKEKKPELVTLKLEELLVTLADKDELHYLKTSMSIEMECKNAPPKGGEGAEEDNPEKAKILDVINTTLSDKRLNQLQTEKDKNKLKEELIKKLDSKLDGTKIKNIYFTSFALQ